jgi:hypothetical protein
MARQCNLVRPVCAGSIAGFCCLLAWPGAVGGQEGQSVPDLSALVKQVDPCVVTIKLGNSTGSGFVVDPSGVIATNYHVIEGAKAATVIFPDKKTFAVSGFLAVIPSKDMALLRIDPEGKQLSVLRVAEGPPAKGDRVFAFGAPLGMSGSVSEGIVAALRGGDEVRTTLREMSQKDVYKEVLGYDTDVQWIQTTAPISPGNSGGPLVNARGDVVGINTFQQRTGQNLNFSLSAVHLKELLKHCGTVVQPLSMLPKPRPGIQELNRGDVHKTLAAWKQLNRLKNELQAKLAPCEKKLALIAPADPRNLMKGLTQRLKKKSTQYHTMAEAYSDYASRVKTLKTDGADPKIVELAFNEADLAQRTGDLCEQTSSAGTSLSEEDVLRGEFALKRAKAAAMMVRTVRDAIRIELSHKYQKDFPTLEQTARGTDQADDGGPKEDQKAQTAAESASSDQDRSASRIWTDHTGRYQIQAKFQGMKDGKVRLEKPDGTLLAIPLEKLSEADQRFIGAEK